MPTSWRPSIAAGGSPSTTDSTTYAAWKSAHGVTVDTADLDADGISNFYEYIHGSNPTIADTPPLLKTSLDPYTTGAPLGGNTYLTITFERKTHDKNASTYWHDAPLAPEPKRYYRQY